MTDELVSIAAVFRRTFAATEQPVPLAATNTASIAYLMGVICVLSPEEVTRVARRSIAELRRRLFILSGL
jgi:hypothetical protein